MSIVVDLKKYQYTGPLELLLDLVHAAKIDIKDIFISEITSQYLESMSQIGELDMDSASEFLQMAALLMEIKSRSLLPKPPAPAEEDEETPEQKLIRQLEEYKKYKELSGEMRALEENAQAYITKLPEEYPLPPPTIELTGLTLTALTKAFSRVLKRLEQLAENEQFEAFSRREVRREAYSVAQCMALIMRKIDKGDVSFFSLFEESSDREEVISVFLALLELIKNGRALARQDDGYGDIIISKRKSE